jgi:hypothetical protein
MNSGIEIAGAFLTLISAAEPSKPSTGIASLGRRSSEPFAETERASLNFVPQPWHRAVFPTKVLCTLNRFEQVRFGQEMIVFETIILLDEIRHYL